MQVSMNTTGAWTQVYFELRGILGNVLAIKACQEGTLPFPDGTILATLAWKHVPSNEFAAAFVPGAATTVQIW
jgi:hypothetical protein